MSSPDRASEVVSPSSAPSPAMDARQRLVWHYLHPLAHARRLHHTGIAVVGITSETVPWELIQAAGCFPLVLPTAHGPTPHADEFLEPDVFAPRIRGIFEGIVSGEWSFLRAVIIPRTSEQEYKLFLYLREVARECPNHPMPPVHLYDLLHTRSEAAREYGLGRTAHLKEDVEAIAGRAIETRDLTAAIEVSNAARQAIRRLQRFRGPVPRLTGTEAVKLTGAARYMDRAEFAVLAEDAARALERCRPLPGVRLMIAGSQPDDDALHSRLESLGAVVTAEERWSGGGADVATGNDALMAIFEKYYNDTPSPRVFPPHVADAWFESAAGSGVDGVVFYLPPEDYVAGWDYPRRRRLLDARGIPSVVLREDAATLSEGSLARLTAFIAGVAGSSKPADGR